MAVLNLGEKFVEATGEQFPTAPDGVYEARIVAVKDTVSGPNSKHPGTPMWIVEFAIEDAEHENIRVSSFMQLPGMEGSEWMEEKDINRCVNALKRLWDACGMTSEDGDIDSDDLINEQLRIDVELEDNNGKPRNSIRDWLAM
ncbi:DUF669 domain-containing protein [bacterium]|nr:DUF669 domain-containing protein [bacterium]